MVILAYIIRYKEQMVRKKVRGRKFITNGVEWTTQQEIYEHKTIYK